MATKRYGKIERYWVRIYDPNTSRVCILDFRSWARAMQANEQLIAVLGDKLKDMEIKIFDTKHVDVKNYENNN